MPASTSEMAWNNFAMFSDVASLPVNGEMRAAAIANVYMAAANNGGINSFLTASPALDASEMLQSLISIGAIKAAVQFKAVLTALGEPVPASSADDRCQLIERLWTDALEVGDVVSVEADEELLCALQHLVGENEAYYTALK